MLGPQVQDTVMEVTHYPISSEYVLSLLWNSMYASSAICTCTCRKIVHMYVHVGRWCTCTCTCRKILVQVL